MNVDRRSALALIGGFALLPSCASGGSIKVGSKNFTESLVIAEIYAQALEAAGFRVTRHMNLGSTQIAMEAIARGDIDLYPEYTGTALIDVLHRPPMSDPHAIYTLVRDEFARRYGLRWLQPSPMNDSQGLATTREIAARLNLRTLSQLSSLASRLRLATIPEFLSRPDGLPGLQKRYGGFHFQSVRTYDIALKYRALLDGKADIATAFTTDGTIATNHLVVLTDDKHLWPPYNVAPVVRESLAKSEPKIAQTLDAIAPRITTDVAQAMNAKVEDGNADPSDVAAAFLRGAR